MISGSVSLQKQGCVEEEICFKIGWNSQDFIPHLLVIDSFYSPWWDSFLEVEFLVAILESETDIGLLSADLTTLLAAGQQVVD